MRIAAIFLSLCLTIPTVSFAQDQERRIIVQGEGMVSTQPDMAVINLGVTREARTASVAMDAASVATSQVLAVIADAGIAQADVQTSSINLSPRWDHSKNGQPILSGYVASNTLSVRVRDLDSLPVLLDAVIGTGANTLNGLAFTVADSRPLEDKARSLAVVDARAKAALLAEAAGVALGPVVTITESGGAMPPVPMMRATAMEQSMAVPIATGEVDFRASVGILFDIVDQ